MDHVYHIVVLNDTEHCGFWIAKPVIVLRKATKLIDPCDQPGDIITKGNYFCKVKYYELKDARSHKYELSRIPHSTVDFDNIVVVPDITWWKTFRSTNNTAEHFQLSNRDYITITNAIREHAHTCLLLDGQVCHNMIIITCQGKIYIF